MIIKTYSYRFAEEILQHPNYIQVYNEIISVCEKCPLPLYNGKSARQPRLNIVQQIMNTYFKMMFTQLGWEPEPLATPLDNADALRSDFRKSFVNQETGEINLTAQIEVEFGNVASSYRNYFKFQLSFSYGLTDVCIIILPSQQLSTRIDSGVSNYEKTIREIPSAKLSVTVPVLVVGLFDRNDAGDLELEWNVREIEEDLDILKGDKLGNILAHREIVQSYIDSL